MARPPRTGVPDTAEYEAAAALVASRRPRVHLTQHEMARMIVGATESLWYSQARRWTTNPPLAIAPNSRAIFSKGCEIVATTVARGYDREQRSWWGLDWVVDPPARAAAVLLLMDTASNIRQLRDLGVTAHLVSRGFDLFFDVVLGTNWEERYTRYMRELRRIPTQEGTRPR